MEFSKRPAANANDVDGCGKEDAKPEIDEHAVHTHRVESFSSGGNSALMHALKLAAKLVTTESNIYRDESDSFGNEANLNAMGMDNHTFNQISTTSNAAMMMMMMMNAGGGGGRMSGMMGGNMSHNNSINSNDSNNNESNSDGSKKDRKSKNSGKKDGDRIIPTDDLEAELEQRFERLAQMLDEGEENADQGNGGQTGTVADRNEMTDREIKPLGSLRLMLAEFFVACIKQTSSKTVNRITELGVPKTLLRLFDRYRWSSMLHGVITAAIKDCLQGGTIRKPGRMAWFEAGLIPWMLEVWRRNSIEEGEMGAPRWGRCGYLGHLIRIGTDLKSLLDDHKGDSRLSLDGHNKDNESTSPTPSPKKKVELDEANSPGLPEPEDIEQFMSFAEIVLKPAQYREDKPLCDDNGSGNGRGSDHPGAGAGGSGGGTDEGEEATDVLVMGGIQFVEGLSASGRLDDDEGEIKPVDTAFEDLENLATEEVESIGISPVEVDHDVPAALREEMSRSKNSNSSSKKVSSTSSNRSESSARKKDTKKQTSGDRDSSSDDDGSYEAFVDVERKSSSSSLTTGNHVNHDSKRNASKSSKSHPDYDTGNLASQMGKMRMADNSEQQEAPSASLDGVVIEIDDEEDANVVMPPTVASAASAANNSAAALMGSSKVKNSVELVDDEASSDEDYETWEDHQKALEANKAKQREATASANSSSSSKGSSGVSFSASKSGRKLAQQQHTSHDQQHSAMSLQPSSSASAASSARGHL